MKCTVGFLILLIILNTNKDMSGPVFLHALGFVIGLNYGCGTLTAYYHTGVCCQR